jgi:hypothetical protein
MRTVNQQSPAHEVNGPRDTNPPLSPDENGVAAIVFPIGRASYRPAPRATTVALA